MGIFNDNLYSYEEMEEKCRLHFIAGEIFYQFAESYEPRDWSISLDKGDFSEYELTVLCDILSLKVKEKKRNYFLTMKLIEQNMMKFL